MSCIAQPRGFMLAGIALCLSLSGTPARGAEADAAPSPPSLHLGRTDAVVAAGGILFTGIGKFLLNVDTQEVPPGGLDRGSIALGWDRRALGPASTSARTASDVLLLTSLPLPALLNAAAGGPGLQAREARLWRIQGEALLITTGVTALLKPLSSRPRAFNYLPESERPSGSGYDPSTDRAFASFPSGHAATAWASAMSGVAYLASERPDLSPLAHFLVGMVGAGVATSTGLLRIEAGQHFPSDVAMGSLLGGVSGVGIALLHQGPAPERGSRARAWRSSLLGVTAGVGIALLVTPPTSPWVD